MTEYLLLWGGPGLFVLSFLAATLLPFSSEAFLVAGIFGGIPVWKALLFASAGNSIACLFNYVLGYYIGSLAEKSEKNPRRTSRSYRFAHTLSVKYGLWTIPLSWLPLIGDPLLVIAGIFHFRAIPYLSGAIFFRIIRYLFIAYSLFPDKLEELLKLLP